MERGEVHLAPFLYSDLQGVKRRPVCVVSSAAYNRGPDAVVAMVTSHLGRSGLGDVVIRDWESAGLWLPSVVRVGRLQTLERRRLDGPLGTVTDRDLTEIDAALLRVLGLP